MSDPLANYRSVSAHIQERARIMEESVTYDVPRSVIEQQCDRDHGLMQTLTFRCEECKRHGPAKDGTWHVISGVCYCAACWNAEAHV